MNLLNMKDYDGWEIDHFNNDEACITTSPNKDCKFILHHEIYRGEYSEVDKFYILHLDINGIELNRFDAMGKTVNSIFWSK